MENIYINFLTHLSIYRSSLICMEIPFQFYDDAGKSCKVINRIKSAN